MDYRAMAVQALNNERAIGVAIQERMGGPGAFEFLDALRQLGIESRANLPGPSLALMNAETSALVGQYKALDVALQRMLEREGLLDAYKNHRRTDDPDLPADPNDLADPAKAFKYGLMVAYRRQFEVTLNQQKAGGWPILVYDLLAPIDGKRTLLVEQFPEATIHHADSSYLQGYSSAQAFESARLLREVEAGLNLHLANLLLEENQAGRGDVATSMSKAALLKKAIKAVRAVVEVVGGMQVIHEAYATAKKAIEGWIKEQDRKAAEAAAQKEWDDLARGRSREIERSSDHVDQFDKNRDLIGRSC